MASDTKDHLDTQQAHQHKSPVGYQNPPTLTGKQALACDMDRSSAFDESERTNKVANSRFYLGGKLLAPLAVWILIVMAGLCFLSLMSSLNRTIITLDELVKLEQQRMANDTDHETNFDQPTKQSSGPKASDWLAMPGWMSLEPPKSTRKPKGGPQDMQSLLDEIFQAITDQQGIQDAPISGGGIIISSEVPLKEGSKPAELPEDLINSMMGQMFGPVEALRGEQRLSRKPGSPITANIEKLNINIHGDQQQHKLRGQSHRQESTDKPTPEELRSIEDAIDSLVNKLSVDAAAAHEAKRLPSPVGMHQPHLFGRPQPLHRPHQKHSAEDLPEFLVPLGFPVNSPLEDSIPPMFGRPSMNGPIVISLDGEMPSIPVQNLHPSPYEFRPNNKDADDDNERLVFKPKLAGRRPEERMQLTLEDLLNGPPGQSEDLLLDNRPTTTSRPGFEEPSMGMQDLFKLFFGPPPTHNMLTVRPEQNNRASEKEEQQPLGKLAKLPEVQLQRDSNSNGRLFPDEDRIDVKDLVSMIIGQPDAQAKSKSNSSRLFPSEERVGAGAMIGKILGLADAQPERKGKSGRLFPSEEQMGVGDVVGKILGQPEERPTDAISRENEKSAELEPDHPDSKEAEELAENLMNMLSSPQFSGSTQPAQLDASVSSPMDKDESSSSIVSSTVGPTSQSTTEQTTVAPAVSSTRQRDLESNERKADIATIPASNPVSSTRNPDDSMFRVEFTSQHPLNFRSSSEILEESVGSTATPVASSKATLAPITFDFTSSDRSSSTASNALANPTVPTSTLGSKSSIRDALDEIPAASKLTTTERPKVSASQDNSTKSPFKSFIDKADDFIKGNLLSFRRFIAQ